MLLLHLIKETRNQVHTPKQIICRMKRIELFFNTSYYDIAYTTPLVCLVLYTQSTQSVIQAHVH